jgi:hypothetical protein
MVDFYGRELLAPPNPKLQDHHLSAVRNCFSIILAAILHPQPEDMPCCGDKGPTYYGSSNASFSSVTIPGVCSTCNKPVRVHSFILHLTKL